MFSTQRVTFYNSTDTDLELQIRKWGVVSDRRIIPAKGKGIVKSEKSAWPYTVVAVRQNDVMVLLIGMPDLSTYSAITIFGHSKQGNWSYSGNSGKPRKTVHVEATSPLALTLSELSSSVEPHKTIATALQEQLELYSSVRPHKIILAGATAPQEQLEQGLSWSSSVKPHKTILAEATAPQEQLDASIQVFLGLHQSGQNFRIAVDAGNTSSFPNVESLQFFFSNEEGMAACVGVGLSQSKVILSKDLTVTVHQLTAHEYWNSLAALWPNGNPKLVMQTGKPTEPASTAHMSLTDSAESLSKKYGVILDAIFNLQSETEAASQELRAPLLYEIAWSLLREVVTEQCHDAPTSSKSGPREGSASTHTTSDNNTMLQNLASKMQQQEHVQQIGNGGNGDENEHAGIVRPLEEDEVVLEVIVVPLSKRELRDGNENLVSNSDCYGLITASIAPELVFVFRQKHGSKKFSINVKSALNLKTDSKLPYDYFGWYQNDILMSVSCKGEEQSGRAVRLEEHKMCEVQTKPIKLVSRSSTTESSTEDAFGIQAGLGIPAFGQVGTNASRKQQVKTSQLENNDFSIDVDTVCKGFQCHDSSCTEKPACLEFTLNYPLPRDLHDILANKVTLSSQGLCSTITPKMESTWIPLNEENGWPYMFSIKRPLEQIYLDQGIPKIRSVEQEYLLTFFINHAMSHLKRPRSEGQVFQLIEDSTCQEIENVLKVANTF